MRDDQAAGYRKERRAGVAHHLLPLSPVAKLAAEELLRFIRSYVPVEMQGSRRHTIQIGAKLYPLEQGWQRYFSGGRKKSDMRRNAFGMAFGKTFDHDGFRYPASQDSLQAPWECHVLHANPDLPINVYFVTEMSNGSSIELHVNSKQDSMGFGGVPNDEFQIPAPPRDRSWVIIIDTRSLPRLGMEPRRVRGLRVRGPTKLSSIGMFESKAAVPARFRRKRDSIEIVLP